MKRSTKRILSFVIPLCSLCLCGESFGLDPEPKTPYRLQVVLHFADHRLLTDVFRDRVERELRDGLQASFGDLARVEVTREHPRLNEVLRDGLKALDGWKERFGYKTHFVLVDFSGVHYEIQARQYDGYLGQPGPVVRRDRTRDREFVAKAAALLIDQDFGLLGTFDSWPKADPQTPNEDKQVTVDLKGSALGVPLDRWVKKGDVFAVVQMPRSDGPGRPVPGALLRVETPPGAGDAGCVCRVFRRYDPPRDSDGDGYRCVRLGTVSAPLRLRLLQALPNGGSGPLKDSVTVQIRHNGFDKEDLGKVEKPTDNSDSVDTAGDKDGVFDNAAFVSVYSAGDVARARVPVPLFDDQPIPLSVNVAADASSLFAFRKADWERHVNAAWQEQNQLFKEINDGAAKADKRTELMKRIEEGVQRSRDDYDRLKKEQEEVAKGGPLDAPATADRMKKVLEGATELEGFLGKLKKIDAEENDPHKKTWLAQFEQGQRLEKDLEMDKAIALYEEMLKGDAPDDAAKEDLTKYLKALKEKWMAKSPEHQNARKFIYNVWPTLDDAGLKDKLQDARGAYIACKAAGDLTSLTKLFRATEAHAVRLKQELDALKPDINIDDEKQAKLIKEVSDGLLKLARDVNETLQTAGR